MKLGLLLAVAALACSKPDVSRELGAACTTHTDCDQRCLPASNEYPGGFCTRSCLSHAECPDTSVCIERQEGDGVCLYECFDNRDCVFLGSADGRQWLCKEKQGIGGDMKFVCVGD